MKQGILRSGDELREGDYYLFYKEWSTRPTLLQFVKAVPTIHSWNVKFNIVGTGKDITHYLPKTYTHLESEEEINKFRLMYQI